MNKDQEICCEPFKMLQNEFGWYGYDEDDEKETRVYIMPYLESGKDGIKYRINFCPSCGKDVRQIKLTE